MRDGCSEKSNCEATGESFEKHANRALRLVAAVDNDEIGEAQKVPQTIPITIRFSRTGIASL